MIQKQRNFIKKGLKIEQWSDIEPYLEDLKNRKISSAEELMKWWKDRSETEAFLEEDAAWRYINMTCDTKNEKFAERFNFFVSEIEPKLSEYSDILDKKIINSPFLSEIEQEKYFVPLRSVRRDIELFRKANIPLFAELQKLQQQFGSISGAMSIQYKGEELTMQQAANYLKETKRSVRKEVYEMINKRRAQDAEKLNELLDKLLRKRHKIARNANYNNYRDYKFDALKRFDYSLEDNLKFHEAIKEKVVPLKQKLAQKRKQELGLDKLQPYDMQVDTSGKPPLKPFSSADELLHTTIEVFRRIRPKYGKFLETMKEEKYLDLESRLGKAPGGYNYPLYESNIPFIFMNASGNIRDVETLIHEGGHAVHSFLGADLELTDFKNLPSELAELASMSMELISLEHRGLYFDNEEDTIRAKRHQLEGVIQVLPWVATIDKFQHLLYTKPGHNAREREKIWLDVFNEFNHGETDWTGYEEYKKIMWQKQLHIFEVPFYYIEYAISQLGAVAVWRNYNNNPEKALDNLEAALKLGYSKTIPDVYRAAGIRFDFGSEYIGELMDFVSEELQKLD